MSAYAYINGIVRCEDELDGDIVNSLSEIAIENENWHKNSDGELLFSFDIKECRMDDFCNIIDNSWIKINTKDSVIDEWYPIEICMLVKYESNADRIDCVEIKNHSLTHRKTYS